MVQERPGCVEEAWLGAAGCGGGVGQLILPLKMGVYACSAFFTGAGRVHIGEYVVRDGDCILFRFNV